MLASVIFITVPLAELEDVLDMCLFVEGEVELNVHLLHPWFYYGGRF